MGCLFELLFEVSIELMFYGFAPRDPANSPATAVPKTKREKLYLVFKIIITTLCLLLLSGIIMMIAASSPTLQTVAKYVIIISVSLLGLLILSSVILITIATIRRKKQK